MDTKSPETCPHTASIRRNPHRKARSTLSTTTALPNPLSSNTVSSSTLPDNVVTSFPIEDILSIEFPQNPKQDPSTSSVEAESSQNLKVFLRIRPIAPLRSSATNGGDAQSRTSRGKNAWPQSRAAKNGSRDKKKQKKTEVCITVNDSQSVTLTPPQALQDLKRTKSEVFSGFSHVFPADSSQNEVYERMVNPLVDDFLRGVSGMLAALGPSGSGKTHTVFGSPREPGMVPLLLRQIFKRTWGNELNDSKTSRSFCISMFEIYSEGGKGERLLDLSPEGADLHMQQSAIKGLQEIIISDIAHAESLIAQGMLKRTTAMTNSNSQSSRSQCIINIHNNHNNTDGENVQSNRAVLTIVDLAGAEREKRTGNQGARLLESNFINNTSMVFGLCLRSLLEHQKNRKKPLQKHFQNSLLTRYLREYLEGKKRMALILTVKSGDEDYLDTSFLLRQASPYMKIKFNSVEEPSNLLSNKRHVSVPPRSQQPKRIKFGGLDTSVVEGKRVGDEEGSYEEGVISEQLTESGPTEIEPSKLLGYMACIDWIERGGNSQIMPNLAEVLRNALKQYQEKLEVAENEIRFLKDRLKNERIRNLELEQELRDLKSGCSCYKVTSAEASLVRFGINSKSSFSRSPELNSHGSTKVHELNEEPEELKSNHSCCAEVSAEDSFVKLDTSSKCSRVDRFTELKGHGSANDHETKVDVDVHSPDREEGALRKCNYTGGQDQGPFLQVNSEGSLNLKGSKHVDDGEKSDALENAEGSPSLNGSRYVDDERKSDDMANAEDSLNLNSSQYVDDERRSDDMAEGSSNLNNSKYVDDDQKFDAMVNAEGSSNLNSSKYVDDEGKSDAMVNAKGSSNLNMCQYVDEQKCDAKVEAEGSSNLNSSKCVDDEQNSDAMCINLKHVFFPGCANDAEATKLLRTEDTSNAHVAGTCSQHPKSLVRSSERLVKVEDDTCFSVKENQPSREDDKESSVQIILPKEPREAVAHLQDCNGTNAQESELKVSSCSKPLNVEKPRRRLLPASSILVKNISGLGLEDEEEKPKGKRGEKKLAAEERNRTQGSTTLLRLLRTNLHL
ncbi:kinesin-like protein KIN-6 isoform X2 [Malania oleifera]|uniref:kinesin-like protein KIN-6 isoform X2 n=1 Tax=Malania oleifera TaxID=397392 RepID=UPI0025AE3519|nr:kinesin-like protein KIN-6 isoform X2 [Malania oleifera]